MATTRPFFNIAHRGARSLAPENTMAAIEKAWQVGAHGVEVDVTATLDGELILLHDESLRRTTNVDQLFAERRDDPAGTFLFSEIRTLDAGSWFIENDPFDQIALNNVPAAVLKTFASCTIPTLGEALEFIKERSWFINIELKGQPPASCLERLLVQLETAALTVTQFAISSFDHYCLQQLKEKRPEFEYNALIGGSEDKPQDWGDYEFEIYNANVRLIDEKQIARAQAHGCRVNLYTVNDPEQMKRFLAAGVEKIITDYPQVLSAIRR